MSNPANDEFFIDLNSSNFNNIEIIDILGKVMFFKEDGSNLISINTSEFSKGTYFFIKIQDSIDIRIYKLIIEK